MKLIDPEEAKQTLRSVCDDYGCTMLSIDEICAALDKIPGCRLRLMNVKECAGHTIEYAKGWKACVGYLLKGLKRESWTD